METREQLKKRCKLVMKQNYWIMFLVSLVGSLLMLKLSSLIRFDIRINPSFIPFPAELFSASILSPYQDFDALFYAFNLFLLIAILLSAVATLLYQTFVGGPVCCGMARFFYKNTESNQNFSELFTIFSSHYLNVCKTMFLVNIKLIGWTMLLIVPGIVKYYEYSMIPYLLAENPDLSSADAFRLSREMTSGEKMNLFVLDLSFIGWQILGNMLIIGHLFVAPYRSGTWAEAYRSLKEKHSCASYF